MLTGLGSHPRPTSKTKPRIRAASSGVGPPPPELGSDCGADESLVPLPAGAFPGSVGLPGNVTLPGRSGVSGGGVGVFVGVLVGVGVGVSVGVLVGVAVGVSVGVLVGVCVVGAAVLVGVGVSGHATGALVGALPPPWLGVGSSFTQEGAAATST